MFQSKIRPLIIPQSEHARLAGVLASLWGNAVFDRPALDWVGFVKGVTFHDRGYGLIDNFPIGVVDEVTWLGIMRQGIESQYADPIADVLVLIHIQRLLRLRDTPERKELADLAESSIQKQLRQHHLTRKPFEWADRITRFCDSVAFHFAFGAPVEVTLPVYSQTTLMKEIVLTYTIESNGNIIVNPWPFAVDQGAGFIIGYQVEGYPDRLEPDIISWRIHRTPGDTSLP